MNHTVVLILACLTLVASVQAAAPMQNFNCNPGVQNISPKGMGQLDTIEVFEGSLIQFGWCTMAGCGDRRYSTGLVSGRVCSKCNQGSHILKVSLNDYQDFVANVTICDQGITEVNVQQVPAKAPKVVSGSDTPGFLPSATGTVPVPATTKAPGFELVTVIMGLSVICILRKGPFG